VLQQQLIAGSEKENRCERQQLGRLINPAETPPRTPNQNVFGNLGYIMMWCDVRVNGGAAGNVEHGDGDRVHGRVEKAQVRTHLCEGVTRRAAWPRVASEAGPESHSQTGGARCDAFSRRASSRLLLLLL
jgi:hypothetical protein